MFLCSAAVILLSAVTRCFLTFCSQFKHRRFSVSHRKRCSGWTRGGWCWEGSWTRRSCCRQSRGPPPPWLRQGALWSCDGKVPAGGRSRRSDAWRRSRSAEPGGPDCVAVNKVVPDECGCSDVWDFINFMKHHKVTQALSEGPVLLLLLPTDSRATSLQSESVCSVPADTWRPCQSGQNPPTWVRRGFKAVWLMCWWDGLQFD